MQLYYLSYCSNDDFIKQARSRTPLAVAATYFLHSNEAMRTLKLNNIKKRKDLSTFYIDYAFILVFLFHGQLEYLSREKSLCVLAYNETAWLV